MGRDKALLEVDGAAMARRVADALVAAGATSVVALGGDAEGLAALGLASRPDREPGAGPFPATVQAVEDADEELVLVVACDLVAPSAATMAAVVAALADVEDHHGAVPVVAGHHQWMHAAWRRSALPVLQAERAAGTASLKRAAASLRLVDVTGLPAADLADADAPSDLPGGAGTLPAMDLPEVDVHQLATLRESGVPLIDVREEDEYLEARVPGGTLIPLGQVAERAGEVPTGETVYVICARGGRSAKAAEHLRSLGIDAVNVAGGTLAWIDAGLPTDSGPGSA